MLIELYNKITDYLTLNFGPNFVLFTVLLTTTVSVVYLLVITYMINRLDSRYFLRRHELSLSQMSRVSFEKHTKEGNSTIDLNTEAKLRHKSIAWLFNLVKIFFGLCLLLSGLVMLVLPGQGIITILLGLGLLPFPGKHKLEHNLLSRGSVRSTLNWMRKKAKKEPFIFEQE